MTEEVRTRTILDKDIEEKFPINYDVLQELAEKADALNSCLFVPYCGWYAGEKSKYVEYLAFREVIQNFYISFITNLQYARLLDDDIKSQFLAYKLLFNLISNDTTKIHIGVLNRCKDTNKAWELFNRIEYLINNFETEILLPNKEKKNE